MLSWPRIRSGLLLGLLAALWAYAVITDHPAPAWGASRLPDLYFSTLVLVGAAALVAVMVRAWSNRHGQGVA